MTGWHVTITGFRDDIPNDVKFALRNLKFPKRVEFGMIGRGLSKPCVFVGWKGWWGAEYFTYKRKEA